MIEEKKIIGTDYRLPYFNLGYGEKTFAIRPGFYDGVFNNIK